MAERVGFEPTVDLRLRWFSRPEPSATQPPLRELRWCPTSAKLSNRFGIPTAFVNEQVDKIAGGSWASIREFVKTLV